MTAMIASLLKPFLNYLTILDQTILEHNNNNNNKLPWKLLPRVKEIKLKAVELVQESGRPRTAVTEDTGEATDLFQRLSVALQRGNAVSFHSTFTTD